MSTAGPWYAYFVAGEPITAAIQPGRRQDEWRVDPAHSDADKASATYRNGVSIIASVHGPDMAANAPLIAAAPDLLAALKQLLADPYLSDPVNADRMAAARAAVAKAEAT